MVKAYKLKRRNSETFELPFTSSKSFSRRFLLEANDLYPLLQDKRNKQKGKRKKEKSISHNNGLLFTVTDKCSIHYI